MTSPVKNPCAGCPHFGDYDSRACRHCEKRAAYVTAIGGMTCSMPVGMTDLGGRRGLEASEMGEPIERKERPIMDANDTKLCAACGAPRGFDEFRRVRGGGRATVCDTCRSETFRATMRRKSEQKAGPGMKICTRKDCAHQGAPQPLAAFGANKSKLDGRQDFCRECMREVWLEYRRRKKETAVGALVAPTPEAPKAPDDSGPRAAAGMPVEWSGGDALLSELFGGCDKLLDGLHILAGQELRTPRNQLLYLVQTAIKEI